MQTRTPVTIKQLNERREVRIPMEVVHPFRWKLYTDSDVVVHPGRS
jgi:hypothetical protein